MSESEKGSGGVAWIGRTVWQITGRGVRLVLFRRAHGDDSAHVSRLRRAPEGAGFPAITCVARRADLFVTETEARREAARRRAASYRVDDRRFLREPDADAIGDAAPA